MNTPKIRFKEFNDEWKKEKFKQFSYYSGKRNKNNLNLIPYAITNINGFVPQAEAHNEFGYMKNTNRKAYNIVTPNSFAYNPARINVGSIGYYNGNKDIIVSSLYEVFKTTNYIDDKFLWFWLKSSKLPIWINKLQEGSVRQYFYYDKLCETPLYFPSVNEQKKISKFLSLLDKKIELQSKKIEDLKLFKKGLSTTIFNSLRDFEEYKLGKLCNITTGKLDANAMIDNGKYRFYTCAKEYSFIDKYAFDTEALLISGNGANVGYIHYYKGRFNAYQRTYVLDNFTQNIQFIKCYLDENLAKRINSEKKEGNTPYIVLSTLSDMVIKIPSKENQIKISNIINYHNKKIKLEENKLNKLQELKKGLMQNMFV